MAMLEVACNDCHQEFSLRGWIEKEDLKGTSYEHMMETITNEKLQELYEKGKVKDEWDRFEENPVCPNCGSKNVITL